MATPGQRNANRSLGCFQVSLTSFPRIPWYQPMGPLRSVRKPADCRHPLQIHHLVPWSSDYTRNLASKGVFLFTLGLLERLLITQEITPKHSQNQSLELASRIIHAGLVIQKILKDSKLGLLRVYLVCENKAIGNQAKSKHVILTHEFRSFQAADPKDTFKQVIPFH